MQNRAVIIDGVENVRDLGGIPLPGGRRVRCGRYYRAAAMHRITALGIQQMCEFGIKHVIDLRSKAEFSRNPDAFSADSGIQLHHIPMLDFMNSNLADHSFVFPESMEDLYREILLRHQEEFWKVFEIFATAEEGVLFHCTAGKDRTGLTAMLLLGIVGAAQEDIVQDYALSNPPEEQLAHYPADIPAFVFMAPPQTMTATLQWVMEEYQTIEQYLLTSGVPAVWQDIIRSRLVE